MSKLDLLKRVLQKSLDDDYDEADATETIYLKYQANPETITPQGITTYLKDYIKKDKIQAAIEELEKGGLWQKEFVVDPKASFKNEQLTLASLEIDYRTIPRESKAEPAELLLLRCLIMSLLSEHEKGAIEPTLEQFMGDITPEDAIRESDKLRTALKNEGRISTKISTFLEEISKYLTTAKKPTDPSIFDYLSAIKKEIVPIDVPDLRRLIDKTTEVEKQIDGKSILLFIGETGSGKTTSIKALLGYKMGKSKYKGMNWVTIVEPVTDPKVLDMHSNPSCKSVTRYIVAAKPKREITVKDISFTDTPGWGDTAGVEVQLANLTGVKRALRRCKNVVPVIVISKESWGTRGMGIRNLARTISTLFHDYDYIKNSIAIVINRFTNEEIEEMEAKFKNLLDETEASDRADANQMSFLQHLYELAAEKELLRFEPLESNAKDFVDILLKKPALKPGDVFKNSNPSQDVIKNYCVESTKRIRYHLQNQEVELVKYFIKNMQLLEETINEGMIAEALQSVKTDIQQTLRDDYERTIEQFNNRVRTFAIKSEDIKHYLGELGRLGNTKSYDDIVGKIDWLALGMKNLNDEITALSSWFMREKSKHEEDEMRGHKILNTIMLFSREMPNEFGPLRAEVAKWIGDQISTKTKAYLDAINAGEYQNAATFYEAGVRVSNCQPLISTEMSAESKEMDTLRGGLLRIISGWTEKGKSLLKPSKENNTQLIELDKRLSSVTGCFKLISCQTSEMVTLIVKEVKEFTEELKKTSDKELKAIMKILDDAHHSPVNPDVIESFSVAFSRLKDLREIESIRAAVEDHLDTVNRCVGVYLRSQRDQLKKVISILNKEPEELRNNMDGLDTAIKGIESLAQYGGEQLEKQAKKIKEDTMKQLSEFMPKFLSKLGGVPNNFRYNTPNNAKILQQIYEGKEMESMFQKVSIFKEEYDSLVKRNGQNLVILSGALDSAVRYLKDCIENKEEEESKKRFTKKYNNLNLAQMEAALKFVLSFARDCPFSELSKKASESLEEVTKLLKELRLYFEWNLTSLKEVMNVEGEIPTEGVNVDQFCFLVSERCQANWRVVRRAYQHVIEIREKHELINELGGFDVDLICKGFTEDIDNLLASFSGEERSAKISADKYKRLSVLLKKCETFKSADADVIGKDYDEFVRLRDSIEEQLKTLGAKAVSTLETYIQKRMFGPLKSHIENVRASQPDLLPDTEQKINDFIMHYIGEKQGILKSLKGKVKVGVFDLDLIEEFTEQREEIKKLLSCNPKSTELESLKCLFERQIATFKPKIVENLEDHLVDDRIDEASKTLKLLEAIEDDITTVSKLEASASGLYGNKIADRLNKIQEDLNSEDLNKAAYEGLWNFFKKNPNKSGEVKQLTTLKAKWEAKALKKVDDICSRFEIVELRDEMQKAKKEAEDFMKFIPDSEKPTKKEECEKASKACEVRLEKNKAEIKKAIESLNECKTLNVESVKPQLEYLMKEKNEEVLFAFKQALQALWNRRRAEYQSKSKKAIQGCVKAYHSELIPFIEDSKPYEKLLNTTCLSLKDQFNSFFDAELEKLMTETRSKLAASKKAVDMEESKKLGNVLTETIDEMFVSIQEAEEVKDANPLQSKLERTYTEMATEVVGTYEKVVNETNIPMMFEGRQSPNALSNFETILRLGGAMSRLAEQIQKKNIPAKIKGDSMAGFKTKIDELPKSEEVKKEFVQKMDECTSYVQTFDITSDKYYTAGETEINDDLKKFKTGLVNTNNLMNMYMFLGKPKVDTVNCEKKLKNDIRVIYVQSQDAVKKLDEEYQDKTLQKLNVNTLTLVCFQKSFPEEQRYGEQVKQSVESKIQKDSERIVQLTTATQAIIKGSEKIMGDLKTKERDELATAYTKLEDASKAKVAALTESWDKQINGQTDEAAKQPLRQSKQAELDAEAADLKTKKADAMKLIKAKYEKSTQAEEKKYKQNLENLSKQLTRLKQIEVGLIVGKDECKKSIEKAMTKAKEGGTKFSNMLAKELEDSGTGYANIILNENPKVFAKFTSKSFKARVANQGYEYVANKIPYLSEGERKNIMTKYEEYKKHLDTFTKDYSQKPEQSFMTKLKGMINTQAAEVAKDYKNKNPTMGHELLAKIFALWMIKKADVSDEEGVEYLYEPHPAQIISMFLILGICGDRDGQLGNRIAQVLTGEGKSVVLGGLSCYLAVIGYDVYCMCYSRLLSRRDYEDFMGMFTELNILENVIYGTFGEVTESLFNSSKRILRNDVKDILLNDKDCSDSAFSKLKGWFATAPRPKTLLVDEVDVFFAKEFFGQYYTPSTSIKDKCIEELATFAWQNRSTITIPILTASPQFKACSAQFPKLKAILDFNAIDMVSSVKNYKHNYIIHDGRIGYVLPEGISFQASYGWKTTFAYFYEAERGTISVRPQDYASISVLCCEMSYAELPREFSHIMGVTGTLDILPASQKKVLNQWYSIPNFYFIPSVYGESRRDKYGARVVKKENHFAEICKAIKEQTIKKRPVIVFFPTIDMVYEFYLCKEFLPLKENSITLTEKNDAESTKTRIIRATRAENITIMTRAFGRGIDFIVGDKDVKAAGGMHVIQTFISEEQSESKQIEGRTARQGGVGSYELLIEEDELKKIGLSVSDVDGKDPAKTELTINKERNDIFEKTFFGNIAEAKKCEKSHKTANEILDNIKHGKNDKVREEINNLNKVEMPLGGSGKTVKTVIGIDATGSMSSALAQVLANTKECLFRTYEVLKDKGVTGGFEIQMVIYRNYNSDVAKLLQWSPFSNNANDLVNFLKGISTDGGWGNQAIENLYNHILKFETEVDQLIIIGDAAGNSPAQVKQKRGNKGETYWKSNPRFADTLNGEDLINQLVAKKIPVHSFYIGLGPAAYFKDVSTRTGGECSQYKYSQPDAAKMLTDFIVLNVLKKIGGGGARGDELVAAYRMRFS